MRKRMLILFAVTLICTCIPVVALATEEDEWIEVEGIEGGRIHFDAEMGTIIECERMVTKADIPQEIGGVPVTSIGPRAFYDCELLTDVVIPEGVTTIEYDYRGAFERCSQLKNITLPSSLEYIGEATFSGCSSLTNVSIPVGVTYIGDEAFWGCESVSTIVIPEGVKNIGVSAFRECISLSSVVLPESIDIIGDYAFYGCKKLSSITIPSVEKVGREVFAYCEALTNLVLPYGTSAVGGSLVRDCINLQRIIVPETVTEITHGMESDSPFAYCDNLTSAGPIGSGCTIEFGWTEEFPYLAFSNCGSLEKIIIPGSVEKINVECFVGCDKLTSAGPIGSDCTIEFGWTKTIPDYAFLFLKNLSTVILPEGIESIGYDAFGECNNLTEITIPSTVRRIDGYAFSHTGLTEVVIPDGVLSINAGIFFECEKLTTVSLPEGIKSIGQSAFAECAISNIDIPSTINCIESGAFRNCESLEFVIIPEGVKEIASQTFSGCKSLSEITLPKHITMIGSGAFSGCFKLADTYFGGSEEEWSKITMGSSNDCLLYSTIHFKTEDIEETMTAYSLTFQTNGGSSVEALSVAEGTAIALSYYIPTKEGYVFAGWYSDQELTESVTSVMINEDVTVYAKWIEAEEGIAYYINEIVIRDSDTYELLEDIPKGKFLVEVNVTNLAGTENDIILLVQYTEQGQMLGMQYLYASTDIGETVTFGASVDNKNGKTGKIKAMVLPSLGNPVPLANAVEIS